MEKLKDTDSPALVMRRLRYLMLRIAARPEVAALTQQITERYTSLTERNNAYDLAVDHRIGATAEIVYHHERLAATVATLARDVNVLVAGDTSDPRYMRLFLATPSEAMRPHGGDDQARFVRNLIDVLSLDDTYASSAVHLDTLRTRERALTVAFERRAVLQLAEDRARRELDIASDEGRVAYNTAVHHASLAFPDDASLVESFFLRTPRPQPKSDEENTPRAANTNAAGDAAATATAATQPANEATRRRRRRRAA
jgi:hypothetical protein